MVDKPKHKETPIAIAGKQIYVDVEFALTPIELIAFQLCYEIASWPDNPDRGYAKIEDLIQWLQFVLKELHVEENVKECKFRIEALQNVIKKVADGKTVDQWSNEDLV
jgi:hypothetical protein